MLAWASLPLWMQWCLSVPWSCPMEYDELESFAIMLWVIPYCSWLLCLKSSWSPLWPLIAHCWVLWMWIGIFWTFLVMMIYLCFALYSLWDKDEHLALNPLVFCCWDFLFLSYHSLEITIGFLWLMDLLLFIHWFSNGCFEDFFCWFLVLLWFRVLLRAYLCRPGPSLFSFWFDM